MLLNEINPYVRQAILGGVKLTDVNDVFNEIKTYDHRLFYILSDGGNIIINNTTYPLKYGTTILFQSGTKYVWSLDNISEIKFISVNFDYTQNYIQHKKSMHPQNVDLFDEKKVFEKIVFRHPKMLNSPIVLNKIPSFEKEIKQLTTDYLLSSRYKDEMLSSLLKYLIIKISNTYRMRQKNKQSDKHYKLVNSIIEYIQNNYMNPITNTSIAEHFCINPVYMNKIFKEYSGKSIHAFILDYRLTMSCILLKSEDVSIEEIALSVGYTDATQYSKMFKKHKGISPKDFRKH